MRHVGEEAGAGEAPAAGRPARSPSPGCVVDGCSIRGEFTVCGSHYHQLKQELRAIPGLFARLTPEPKSPSLEEVHQKPIFESKSPADDHAIMMADARSVGGPIWTMQEWQKAFWTYKIGLTMAPDREIDVLADRLAVHWQHWASTEYAKAFFDEIHHIWLTLSQSVGDLPAPAVLGLCECGTRVFRIENAKYVRCVSCGREFADLARPAIEKAVRDHFFASVPYWLDLGEQESD